MRGSEGEYEFRLSMINLQSAGISNRYISLVSDQSQTPETQIVAATRPDQTSPDQDKWCLTGTD